MGIALSRDGLMFDGRLLMEYQEGAYLPVPASPPDWWWGEDPDSDGWTRFGRDGEGNQLWIRPAR